MSLIINIHEAKTHLSRILEEVKEGKEVILAKSGRPIARLVPFENLTPRISGIAEGQFDDSFFDPLPEEELSAWGQ